MASSGFAPPPFLHTMRWERMLIGRCPLLGLLVQGLPPLPRWHVVHWERTLPFGGVPPFLRPHTARSGCARPVPFPLLPARGLRVLLGLGGTSLSCSWPRGGFPCCRVWGSPRSPAAGRRRALLGDGLPPLSPPWRLHALSAHDRSGGPLALSLPPFWSPFRERVMQGSVPLLLQIRLVLVRCGPMASLATGVPRVGLVDRRTHRRQSAVLAAR